MPVGVCKVFDFNCGDDVSPIREALSGSKKSHKGERKYDVMEWNVTYHCRNDECQHGEWQDMKKGSTLSQALNGIGGSLRDIPIEALHIEVDLRATCGRGMKSGSWGRGDCDHDNCWNVSIDPYDTKFNLHVHAEASAKDRVPINRVYRFLENVLGYDPNHQDNGIVSQHVSGSDDVDWIDGLMS